MEVNIDEVDKNIVKVLQDDFPIAPEPYKELSKAVGISEDEFIARLQRLKKTGALRKMGAVLRHPKVGFSANVLCAWEVPQNILTSVAENMSGKKEITHCYERNAAEGWNYNLYTMIHGKTRKECEDIINKLKNENNLKTSPLLLYSKKEWKKTGMKYFTES